MTKAKRKSVTTKNTTKKKKVITPVIELVDISEQDKRRIHGEKFEEEMDMLLIKAGVPGNKVTINSPELGSVISDHCYENYWIESTTWFDKKRVDELTKQMNDLKDRFNQLDDSSQKSKVSERIEKSRDYLKTLNQTILFNNSEYAKIDKNYKTKKTNFEAMMKVEEQKIKNLSQK